MYATGIGLLSGISTITGRAQYFSGQVQESWRDYQGSGGARCSACEADVASDPDKYRTRPMRDKVGPNGEVIPWCRCQIKDTISDKRPGVGGRPGDRGWALYVANLIPTTGGTLPGWARLQGDIPADIIDGTQYTLQGEWVGTAPNNLCVNCGWDFRVTAQATEGTEGPTGALDQNSPEMVEARIEVLQETARKEAIEGGATEAEAEAIAVEAVEEERELIRTGYVVDTPDAGPAAGAASMDLPAFGGNRILWGAGALLALLVMSNN